MIGQVTGRQVVGAIKELTVQETRKLRKKDHLSITRKGTKLLSIAPPGEEV